MSGGRVRAGGAVALAAVAGLSAVSGHDDAKPPSFPAQAEAITVDVVVLDKTGQPVRGLSRDDFTLLDGGRPQAIVAFEARDLTAAERESRKFEQAGPPPRVATNVGDNARPGRVLVVVIDDLGLTAPLAQQVGPSLARWIREKAEPSDEITLQTTSGDLWWSADVGAGRDDLVAVLDRLRGKKPQPSATEVINEVEAYQIVVHESRVQAGELESSRGDEHSITKRDEEPSPPPRIGINETVLDRVATRLVEAKSCFLVRAPRPAMFRCKQMALTLAEEVHGAWLRRANAVLDLLKRASADLASRPGRKSVLLVSDDFLRDLNLEHRLRDAVDAAQRGNTALYFSRASGLTGPGSYSAAIGGNPHPSDMGTMGVELAQVAVAGGEHLADATGGASITTSNDLSAGLARLAADGSAYYHLGYQPERAPDGKWHRLEVKVRGAGLQVRARRGYTAAVPRATLATPVPERRQTAPPALPVLSAGQRDQLPLRVASYLRAPDGAGSARVLVVVEIDGARFRSATNTGVEKARLELGILAVSRDRPKILPLAESLELTLRPQDKGWWALFREVRLPPGIAQLRVRVRDPASGAVGAIAQRVEIPDVDAPYLSTPLVSDAVQPPLERGEPPQLVPSARRLFPARGTHYCQYEDYSFGGRDMPGVPRVTGSYTLSRSTGEVVTIAPPTPISTDGSRVVRRLALPLDGMAAGAYELVVTVEDHLAQRTLTARERFEVEATGSVNSRSESGRPAPRCPPASHPSGTPQPPLSTRDPWRNLPSTCAPDSARRDTRG
jgi:VWFA-related protein